MSNTKYIEIDSTYRDRTNWPHPAEFEVSIGDTNVTNKTNARDPVSNSAPVHEWVSTNLNNSGAVTITIATTGTPIVDTNQGIVVIGQSASLQQTEDYYVGLVADDTTNRQRIIGYKYLGNNGANDFGEFILEGSPIVLPFTIDDPTDVTIADHAQIFVPAGRSGSNAYPGYVMYNETQGNSGTILDYSTTTHIATVDATGLGWTVNDAYSIRQIVPNRVGSFVVHSTSTISLNNTVSNSTTDEFYTGDFLRVSNVTPTIPIVAPIYESRRIYRHRGLNTVFGGTVAPGVTSNFTLSSGSSVNGYYVGGYITTAINPTPGYLVTSYDGATRSGTIAGVFGGEVLGAQVEMRTLFVNPAFSVAPTAANIELLMYNYDSYNNLQYNGSMLSQDQKVCYKIELLNLILPNQTLDVGQGSRIAFYPYLYVELSNSSSTRDIIYSNNRNSTKMMFRVPVDDIPNPTVSSFIKIDSDGSTQTVKFKPNDTLHFSVRLPNGELYRTTQVETSSPSAPNGLMQISALFAIKRD